ncbi:hypothetical protein F4777DRAFT_109919 [Nemania sp. FL0916]|nr:hypothetical protein F4777DRAFT_109919 [Nemania sp. FL0916]
MNWPPFAFGNPERESSFDGRHSYERLRRTERYLISWLVKEAKRCRTPVRPEDPYHHGGAVPFADMIRLAQVVMWKGTVPPRALDAIDYILQVRGQWDIGNDRTLDSDTEDYAEMAHEYFVAMSSLRIVSRLLYMSRLGDNLLLKHEPYFAPALPGEEYFAWVCFFNDVFIIREYLKVYWTNYKQSLATLTTSALVTNAALLMIRQALHNQVQLTHGLDNMPPIYKIPDRMYTGVAGFTGPDKMPSKMNDPVQAKENDWEHHEASWCCAEAVAYLQLAVSSLKKYVPPDMPHISEAKRIRGMKRWKKLSQFGTFRTSFMYPICEDMITFLYDLQVSSRKGDIKDPEFLPCVDQLSIS